MLAGVINPEVLDQGPRTPPPDRRKVTIKLKDTLTPNTTTTESPNYSQAVKFSFVTENTRHNKLAEPAYSTPIEMEAEGMLPPYRKETSRWVHIVEPKTKAEGKGTTV